MPWYAAGNSVESLPAADAFGPYVCSLQDGGRAFETYWNTGRGTQAGGTGYHLLVSPSTAQWSRLAAGRSDDLGGVTGLRRRWCAGELCLTRR